MEMYFDRDIVQSSANDGVLITGFGTNGPPSANDGNSFTGLTFQNNGSNGMEICNVVGLVISGDYFENNAANNIEFNYTGTNGPCSIAYGFSITGNLIWGAGSHAVGGTDIVLGSLSMYGNISGNFLGSTYNIATFTQYAAGTTTVEGNSGNTYSMTPDSSGNYHVAILDPVLIQITGQSCYQYPCVVATAAPALQAANVSLTTFTGMSSAPAGKYKATCQTMITIPASTSSTLPACQVVYTDPTIGSEGGIPSTESTANSKGAAESSTTIMDIQASTSIQYQTVGYASSSATAMQYKVIFELERIQ